MKQLNFLCWSVGILIIISPVTSSSQVTYLINDSAPYSYVSGTNPVTSWASDDPVHPADDGYFDLPLGDFAFQFYGVPVSTLRISTNGYMTFGTEGQEYFNTPIPYPTAPNALIAPFWADFDLSGGGRVQWAIFGTPPLRQAVVEWYEVPTYNSYTDTYSFEVILYESTNEIKFQYSNVVSGTSYDSGGNATVGIENFDGTSGSQFSYLTPSLSNDYAVQFIPHLITVFFDDFSTDKGWTGYEPGGWDRGPAAAAGGENGNPDSGQDHSLSSDNYILGFAIGADYPNDLTEKSIISPAIDCTGQNRVLLKFWRYLNVEGNPYDHATVHVSNDGVNWTQSWENPVFNVTDSEWIQVVFDISSIAANQGAVYIRFTMGPTNAMGRYSGWNIDDLEVTSDYSSPMALYVPSGNSPNPNIDEILIRAGLGIKHLAEIPSDLSDYAILVVSEEGACNSTTADYVKNFVQNGGGAVIMSSTPKLFAGNMADLSSIRDWFGTGTYGNDCGYGTVVVDHPFGTRQLVNDKLDYASPNTCLSPAVYDLDAGSTEISDWSGGGTHSFTHNFGQGRVYYYAGSPGYSEDPDPIVVENGLIVFEAGLLWAAMGCPAPIIDTQPQAQTIESGHTSTLSVIATDAAPLSYQWYKGTSGDTSKPVTGATSSSYTTPVLTQTASYWVRVDNSCGSYADSDTAFITVTLPCSTPNITSQPQGQTIQSGQTASMSVEASGATPLSYQWYQGASGDTSHPVTGATSSSYTTPVLTQTASYWVRVYNSCSSYGDSEAAVITITVSCSVPSIISQPQSQTIQSGQTASMSVEASGTIPLSYQWYQGISGDTSNGLSDAISGTYMTPTLADTTNYWVRTTNTCGSADSNTAIITVTPVTSPAPPLNVSASDGIYVDKVEVTWSASLSAQSYKVYRSTGRLAKVLLTTTTETFFDDITVIPGKIYYYWVKALNDIGTSKFSAYDKGYRSDGSPLVPSNVSASDGIYVDKVEVTWSASLRADSYRVYRSNVLLATTTETVFDDTTAIPGRTYYYRVQALNAIGISKRSTSNKGYRSDGSPLVPSNVSASDGIYVDKVEVTWSAPLRAESYMVYRSISSYTGATKVLLGTTTETAFNDTTAVPGKTYYYRLKALNTTGISRFSAYDKGYR